MNPENLRLEPHLAPGVGIPETTVGINDNTVEAQPIGLPAEARGKPDPLSLRPEQIPEFEAAYVKYYGEFYDAALRLVGDHQQAEDIVQTAFMRASQAWNSLAKGSRKRRNWIHTIARNAAFDHQRRKANGEIPFGIIDSSYESDPLAFGDTCQPSAEDEVLASDFSALNALFARLSPVNAKALRMRFLEDLTTQEGAEQLNVPRGTVASRTFNGLMRIAALAGVDATAVAQGQGHDAIRALVMDIHTTE